MAKYTIGVDFGTLSGRAVVVDTETGNELGVSSFEYPHAVIDEFLPGDNDRKRLPPDWALQHPQDYLDVFSYTIPMVLKENKIDPADVIGIGIDFTACTLIPVKRDGTPLCFIDKYKNEPNAYVKLWKHHAAQDKANKLNEIAAKRRESWLARYGGKISSEWAIPKIWQVLDESPEIFEAADRFIEAADLVVWQLTGQEVRNSCTAGYKAIWHKKEGYPSDDFFAALDPRLENLADAKLMRCITPIGSKAGNLTASGAALTGLKEGIAVAVGNVDAHVTVPAVGIDGPGKMLAIMGTSTCHMLLGNFERNVAGICGVVEDGIMPGFFGYEAGQSCVGDHFAWFTENCISASFMEEANKRGISIFQLLREKAEVLKPGESGLLALDWWNGNRSILVDVDLTGMLIGMTLQTKPEEIYRALIEATAFGTRLIIENFRENGVPVNEFYAAGGIAEKDPMTMQIYSDIIGMPIKISGSAQAPALGSAIFAAVAAGKKAGGYDDVFEAAAKMGKIKDYSYTPNPKNTKIYDKLFLEYRMLHDYFGKGGNDVMKRLKDIKKRIREQ